MTRITVMVEWATGSARLRVENLWEKVVRSKTRVVIITLFMQNVIISILYVITLSGEMIENAYVAHSTREEMWTHIIIIIYRQGSARKKFEYCIIKYKIDARLKKHPTRSDRERNASELKTRIE